MQNLLEPLARRIRLAQHRHQRALDAALAPLNISAVQWNALREIDRNPGGSQHQLAELTFNSDQAFGTLTGRLLRLGLVERQAGGGRALSHRLSSHGATVLAQGRERVLAVYTASFAPLDEDERQQLGRLLTKLLGSRIE
jgi:DNA-binding MarR family transcriptional regulator